MANIQLFLVLNWCSSGEQEPDGEDADIRAAVGPVCLLQGGILPHPGRSGDLPCTYKQRDHAHLQHTVTGEISPAVCQKHAASKSVIALNLTREPYNSSNKLIKKNRRHKRLSETYQRVSKAY